MSVPAVRSPCVGVCAINPEQERCIGCLRTREEITRWLRYSPAERDRIIEDLSRRRIEFDAASD